DQSAGVAERIYGVARQAGRKHKVLSRGPDGTRPDDQTRRAPDCADHAGRCRALAEICGTHARERRLRHRLFLSGRPARNGARSHAGFRRAFAGRFGIRRERLRGNEWRAHAVILSGAKRSRRTPLESSYIPRGPSTPLRFARDDKKSYLGCNAMLEPTQVFSLLKLTPIILPWLIRTRLFTSVGSRSPSGQTNIIRISAFDFGPS